MPPTMSVNIERRSRKFVRAEAALNATSSPNASLRSCA
jgi:hypothetical protein